MTPTSRRPVRRFTAAAALMAGVAGLSACGGPAAADEEPTAAVAFVVGARSNMPPVRLDGDAREALNRAVDNEALVSVVVADGNPSVVESTWLRIEGENDVARQQSAQENRAKVESAITAVRADDDESDLLTALSLAARTVSAVSGDREIVLVDSGLSTTGPLDFTRPGMLDAEPDDVVADVEAADMLPDLCGIRVTVQGLGDTAPPQEPLNIAQRKNLVAIWTAVLEASCAEGVRIVDVPLSGTPDDSLPPVTPVRLPEPTSCDTGVVVLSGGEVAFLPDSAEFLDPSGARDLLRPIAAQIIEQDLTATVTGTTANWGPMPGQEALSLDRAQAVIDVLVELGVSREALRADGVGSNFPEYVTDGGPRGPLDPGAAAANRKVVIAPEGGALACD